VFDILALMKDKEFANGGRGPVMFDCFGFCAEVYKQIGITLPEYDSPASREDRDSAIRGEMSNLARYVEISEPEVPSLVVFRIRPPYVTHIGVMIGPREFIHMIEGAGVSINSLTHHIWTRRIAGFYRYILEV